MYLLVFATVLAGLFDLMWGDFDSAHQPIQAFGDHIPGREVMAYIAGVWMVAAGMALLWRRSAKAGAAALALIYLSHLCGVLVASVLYGATPPRLSHSRLHQCV